jgi:predicted DNA-binding transcriptional regulator YafY
MRERRALDVLYQSMSRPSPMQRVIEPHALAHDGFRWHARAYDRETKEFRDFVLGRMSRPKMREQAGATPADDAEWNAFAVLVIAPHPKLTTSQARAIAIDPRQDRRASSTSCCSTAGRSKQHEFGRRTPETKLLQSAGAQPLLEQLQRLATRSWPVIAMASSIFHEVSQKR